jgi:hypothetical protein
LVRWSLPWSRRSGVDVVGAYHRERYLSWEQTERLKTLLRFVVCEEDHLETNCITCHLPIEVGRKSLLTT